MERGGVMERGRSDGGRGSDGGGGNGGAGLSLSTVRARRPGEGGRCRPCALAVCRWGLLFPCALVAVRGSCGCWALAMGTGVSFVGAESSFVGGGARSGCWALFVGAESSLVGGGARSRAVHARGWGAHLLVGGCCSWEGCSWMLGCRLWARWCQVVCRVVTVSEIG
jgi:hypothetical protein